MTAIVVALAGLAGTPAFAGPLAAGDILLRAGAAHASPDDSSSTVGGIPGSGVDVGSDTQLGLTVAYTVTRNIGVELLAATPFLHDISGTGTLAALGDVASTRHLPPTLSLQYYFMPDSSIRPYLGIGVNYTKFFREKSTASLNAALGGPTTVRLESSVGIAFQVGVDYEFAERWFLNAALWYIDVDTTAILTRGTTQLRTDVSIDPFVGFIGVGRRF